MSLMGIDIGTSGCKTAIYSEEGTQCCLSYRTYRPVVPEPGRMELESLQLLNAILETIREANDQVRDKDPVSALSVASCSEAVIPIDRRGRILGNGIVGSDNRCCEAAAVFKEMDPFEFYSINPNRISFTYTYPKLVWYRDEMPELYRNIWKVLNLSDFLVYYLTGNPGAAYSHANRTLLFDLEREDWSGELLERGGIDRSIFPEPVPGSTVMGDVKEGLQGELGFSGSVKVIAGGHDQCLNALGAGAVAGGQSATGIGTFECITLVFDSIPDKHLMYTLGLNIEHHVVPGKYVSLIYNQAGSLQDWFLGVFAKELLTRCKTDREALDILTSEAPEGPTGVIFLPTLEPTGAPYFLPGMSGSFHGITPHTSRGTLYKALLEGESMYFNDAIERLGARGFSLDEVIASGGGSRSDLWLQIKADVLGKPVRRSGFLNAGTAGAAILAGFASGHYRDIHEATGVFDRKQPFMEPDQREYAAYRDQLSQFQDLFGQLGRG